MPSDLPLHGAARVTAPLKGIPGECVCVGAAAETELWLAVTRTILNVR